MHEAEQTVLWKWRRRMFINMVSIGNWANFRLCCENFSSGVFGLKLIFLNYVTKFKGYMQLDAPHFIAEVDNSSAYRAFYVLKKITAFGKW